MASCSPGVPMTRGSWAFLLLPSWPPRCAQSVPCAFFVLVAALLHPDDVDTLQQGFDAQAPVVAHLHAPTLLCISSAECLALPGPARYCIIVGADLLSIQTCFAAQTLSGFRIHVHMQRWGVETVNRLKWTLLASHLSCCASGDGLSLNKGVYDCPSLLSLMLILTFFMALMPKYTPIHITDVN